MDQNDPSLPFAPGDILADKYRIDRILGVGGMGVVVAATHLDLDSKVAIKVMRRELLSNESAVQRLLLEARSAARIRSEHVARVLDVGTLPEGAPYIVMEFLDGCDLGQLLQDSGPLPVSQAVDFLLEACEALAEAHAAQIIHRDLKPENLFISYRADGSAILKVVDFGISKQLGADVGGRALTNPSTAVGSPQYMAPEQMQARTVDVRADIWALGTILYQSVSGRHAFDGETLPEVCAKVLGEEPPLLQTVRDGLPAALDTIVTQCLRKDPTQRYANVALLAEALAPLGSSNAQRSLERITRVVYGTAPSASLTPAQFPFASTQQAVARAPTVAATTPMSAGSTLHGVDPTKGSGKKWWLLPASLAALLLAGGALMLLRNPASGDDAGVVDDPTLPAASSVAAAPAATTAWPAVAPAPMAVAPVEPATSASATASVPSAAPSVVPVPATAAPVRRAPAPRPVKAPIIPAPKPKASATASEPNAQQAWDPSSFGGRR